MLVKVVFFGLIIALLAPSALFGAEDGVGPKISSEEALQSEVSDAVDIHAIPPILDPHYRHKKKGQFEFSPFGGAYLGNSVGQTWVAGAKAYYYFSNPVGLGVNYGYARLLTDSGSTLGRILTDKNLHAIDLEIILTNDAVIRQGKSMIEVDLFGTFGVGALFLNGEWEPTGQIGGGIKIYPGISWLALRIDVGGYLHSTDVSGKDPIDFDVTMTGGVSFLFPSKPSAYEQKKKVE